SIPQCGLMMRPNPSLTRRLPYLPTTQLYFARRSRVEEDTVRRRMHSALRDLEDWNEMGQTLALIHTSPTLTPMFSELCTKYLPQTSIFHMADESLIGDTIREGRLRRVTMRRLLTTIESAVAAGADAVMVT